MKFIHQLTLIYSCLVANTPTLAQDFARTPEGRPDFQGLWTNATHTPLERPAALGNKQNYSAEEALQQLTQASQRFEASAAAIDPNRAPPTKGANIGLEADWRFPSNNIVTVNGQARTSLIIDPADGRIPTRTPAQDWRSLLLAKEGVSEYDAPQLRPTGERCLLSVLSTAGPPMLPMIYNSNYQIVQSADYLMIMTEMVNDVRIIRIDGQPLPAGMVRWMGDSVGRWEGDTLVVRTDKFHPQQSFRGSTEALTTTEWFSLESDAQINYRVTVSDPIAYTQDWTAEVPLRALGPDERLYEYACHEGNRSVSGALGGARRQDWDAANRAEQ